MDRSTLVSMTAGLSIANGIFSPATQIVLVLWPAWYPSLVAPVSWNFIFFLASIIVSTATLLFSGVAAALYERVKGQEQTDGASAGVWFAAALLLTLPALARFV